MLHEYALDPEALTSWQRFRYFVEKFGVHHGRMISRFPKHWKRLVYDAALRAHTSEIERKRIEEGLVQIDPKLLVSARLYDGALSWLGNAEGQHRAIPFRAIISVANPNGSAEVLLADEVDESVTLWNVPNQKHVRRAASEMAAEAKPLLSAATEILFVDPYFNPHHLRFRRPLEHFLRHAFNANNRLRRIEIHINDLLGFDYVENGCQRHLCSLLPNGVELKLIRWRQRDGGREFHARFILTDRGGICYDPGLDESETGVEGELAQLILLHPDVYQRVWADFQRTGPSGDTETYEYVDEVTIIGTK